MIKTGFLVILTVFGFLYSTNAKAEYYHGTTPSYMPSNPYQYQPYYPQTYTRTVTKTTYYGSPYGYGAYPYGGGYYSGYPGYNPYAYMPPYYYPKYSSWGFNFNFGGYY